ncbi:MAG: hypothetical protein EZS28_019791 [Streblomastix strix]|uniref:Uncharacterized protein n=1 Tax=Streblomastix strix TaxID=222440 RepID=A0A5J4VQB5_9EUKA|nr:MAG: hypothetical protein EZS28_019791 [Streblomastix strix]
MIASSHQGFYLRILQDIGEAYKTLIPCAIEIISLPISRVELHPQGVASIVITISEGIYTRSGIVVLPVFIVAFQPICNADSAFGDTLYFRQLLYYYFRFQLYPSPHVIKIVKQKKSLLCHILQILLVLMEEKDVIDVIDYPQLCVEVVLELECQLSL